MTSFYGKEGWKGKGRVEGSEYGIMGLWVRFSTCTLSTYLDDVIK